ncbi:uncharacterized protein MELLADRAFT_100973 [Melampsora larici-populina 98AG31]|uniref:Uncharacterized protein n=1 Tax=Melampsora larici-populina (strain 98AG31 / pathotype 3-4-7) TaxID=747676 RepID=F4R364_MELLP|nr:uncharacterized protein MELLADRAFT_100973 [Melampsora larici-populina 98AG31]EGG13225.1 hypothetical protein MELLADRAFT_100973 [Melampsora larici-populina 98AG31]
MDSNQKEKLVASKNKLHQMHLEAEEKKRIQAEKERVQAEDRAKRAGSRAPQSSQLPNSTLTEGGGTDPHTADNDGDPIEQEDPRDAKGDEGDDESSEAEGDPIDFKSALKKKILLKEDGSRVPSLEKNIRIKGLQLKALLFDGNWWRRCLWRAPTRQPWGDTIQPYLTDGFSSPFVWLLAFTVPSAEDSDTDLQTSVPRSNELNHAVEFGTVEEARATLAKIDEVLKRTTHFDNPNPPPKAVTVSRARPGSTVLSNPPSGVVPILKSRPEPKASSKPSRIPSSAVESTPVISGSKRKSLKDSEEPSSPSDPSDGDDYMPVEEPKKRSKSKKKKSKKSKDDPPSDGSSTPSESSSSDDSSAISAAELESQGKSEGPHSNSNSVGSLTQQGKRGGKKPFVKKGNYAQNKGSKDDSNGAEVLGSTGTFARKNNFYKKNNGGGNAQKSQVVESADK